MIPVIERHKQTLLKIVQPLHKMSKMSADRQGAEFVSLMNDMNDVIAKTQDLSNATFTDLANLAQVSRDLQKRFIVLFKVPIK